MIKLNLSNGQDEPGTKLADSSPLRRLISPFVNPPPLIASGTLSRHA
ncbi:MAG: hypothetical protein ANABAC_3183 [Anaerolineae bacterium]|nr:MAG: hypothetical protein ANABAC_3183 [Anaerolineae bacterium]